MDVLRRCGRETSSPAAVGPANGSQRSSLLRGGQRQHPVLTCQGRISRTRGGFPGLNKPVSTSGPALSPGKHRGCGPAHRARPLTLHLMITAMGFCTAACHTHLGSSLSSHSRTPSHTEPCNRILLQNPVTEPCYRPLSQPCYRTL